MPFNIPNSLTWARIALIPFFVGIYYLPADVMSAENKNLIATLTFIAAAVTDWFDGYLARSLGQTSAFGAFLDPVADKLMVAAALIVLVHLGRVDSLIALVIIGREITISALRELSIADSGDSMRPTASLRQYANSSPCHGRCDIIPVR